MLKEQDFQSAAELIGCEPAAIKAVCAVEAPRGGFNPDGSPVTLFEGHKFYLYTHGKFAASDPDLCYPKWTKEHYGKTWDKEQARLKRAIKLDQHAAYLSASWGRFQIMGFNFAAAGFRTVEDFVQAMRASEYDQLQAFARYIRDSCLADELIDHRWQDFARLYNGAGYRVNHYDTKLRDAYLREVGEA